MNLFYKFVILFEIVSIFLVICEHTLNQWTFKLRFFLNSQTIFCWHEHFFNRGTFFCNSETFYLNCLNLFNSWTLFEFSNKYSISRTLFKSFFFRTFVFENHWCFWNVRIRIFFLNHKELNLLTFYVFLDILFQISELFQNPE